VPRFHSVNFNYAKYSKPEIILAWNILSQSGFAANVDGTLKTPGGSHYPLKEDLNLDAEPC
jgi:hypothetical protein